jgi:basic membrane protein A and related proteins
MNKFSKIIFVLVALVAIVFTSACQPAATATTAPAAATSAPAAQKPAHKVAVLFPGVVTDQSWNQWGYEGLMKAKADCNVEVAYSENVSQDAQIETMRNYATQGYDIIIGHGGEYSDSAVAVAKQYPNVKFALSNGVVAGGNVSSVKISYRQMGYLAGVLAAYMTKTNYIGMVVGEEIAISTQGFEGYQMGAQATGKLLGKEIKTKLVSTGNWADVNKAHEAGLALISEGIDVLFHVLDTADAGLIAAAQDKGVYAIGLYRDSSNLGPKAVIGSSLGSPTTEVYVMACGQEKFLSGQAQALDVNVENGVDMNLTALVPADIQQKVKDVVAKMKSGEIKVEP